MENRVGGNSYSRVSTCNMRIVRLLSMVLLLGYSSIGLSQDFKLKAYTGAVRYYGDLAPYSFFNSNSEEHFALGISVGIQLTDFFSLNIKYLSSKISGSDRNSMDLNRKLRNLNFQSSLDEIGLISELNINNLFWKGISKYGIQFYISTGLNVFHFDPSTEYNGYTYSLQSLGTEGQGMQGFSKPYSLTQVNIPYGIGIEFKVSEKLNMGIEVTSRITFSDYLDDVSGVYPDFQRLGQENGEISSALSNRAGELPGNLIPKSGDNRGNPDNNDWFVFTGVYVSYYIGKNPITIKKPDEINKENGSLIFPSNN